MRRDRRPYFIRRLRDLWVSFYTRQYVLPAFDQVGEGFLASAPWNIEIWGGQINLGQHVHINASRGSIVRLTTWKNESREGRIDVGNYVLISPGVEILASSSIRIDDNCMLASGCSISDSDWHDTYDRTRELDKYAPVHLEENVWLGLRAVVCKGVTIGRNSIVGAGSVVTKDIPANCIAAGNPARAVRALDPDASFTTREALFKSLAEDPQGMDRLLRDALRENTLLGWLRSCLAPRRSD